MKLLLPIDEILDEWLSKNYHVAAQWTDLEIVGRGRSFWVSVTIEEDDDIWPLDSDLDGLLDEFEV